MTAPVGNIQLLSDANGGAVFLVREPGPGGSILAVSYSSSEQLDGLIAKLQRIRGDAQ